MGLPQSPHGSVHYPGLSPAYPGPNSGQHDGKLEQVQRCIGALQSHTMTNEALRSGKTYELWQLATLAQDADCLKAIQQSGVLSVLISLLDDASLPACQSAAAHVLFRMAAAPTSEAERDAIGQSITNAGAVESLVSLLKAADPACKEAGALALCRLAWTSSNVRDEIFTKMCGASARDTGVSTVVAPLGPLLEGGQASLWQAAAYLAHAVTQDVPAQWVPHLNCGNAPSVIPALCSILGQSADTALFYAASRALVNLRACKSNVVSIAQSLVQQLNSSERFAQEQATRQLWELGLPHGSPDPDLLNLYIGIAGLVSGLAELVHSGSAQACGLAQLLTHETRQLTNRVVDVASADSIRLQLSQQPDFLESLLELLYKEDPEWAALAAQALANMLAYGSGDCARCQRARPAPGFRAGIVAAVSSMQQPRRAAEGGWQCPSHRVASQPGAVEQLLQLLYSSHPPLTKAALFALANMCILDGDVRDFVRHSSKEFSQGPSAIKAKCDSLMGSTEQRVQVAARLLLHSIERTTNASISAGSFFTAVILPPTLPHQPPPGSGQTATRQ